MTTIMQPFQCDLPPQLQETHRTTHAGTTTRCKTHRRNNSRQKRPQPHPPHRRGTFHRRLQPLYTEKRMVSCSGFLPKTEPLQHHAAIPMRSASTDSKTPYNYAHTSTPNPFLNNSPSLSLPFVTTPLHHHFPSSPPPFVTTPLHHHSSPVPFITTSHRNHIPSLPPCVIASYAFVMYSYVIYHPSSRSIP